MRSRYMTGYEWVAYLWPALKESTSDLEEILPDDCVPYSENEVFDAIVRYRGGLASGSEARQLIEAVYGVTLREG